MIDVNPFATRFTRPGALEFLLPDGVTIASLVDQLAANHWRGQIIGPHGSGKSSLLAALRPEFIARGRTIAAFSQAFGQRRLHVTAAEAATWTTTTLVVVDGYEQLGWLARRWLKRTVRLLRAGLLVTAHDVAGFPTLWQTHPSEYLAQNVVAELLASDTIIRPDDVSHCYQAHAGNLRETLFALYDLYELRRRQQP